MSFLIFVLAGATAVGGCAREHRPSAGSRASHHALRLGPGADLQEGLIGFAREMGLRAAAVATCVGSVTRASVRFADRPGGTTLEGKREIVSLVGTLTADGGHLHIALADGAGVTVGGHLLPGTLVYTTAEIVLVELEDVRFARRLDPASGYPELAVEPR